MRSAMVAVVALGSVGVMPVFAHEDSSASRENAQPVGTAPRLPDIAAG